MTSEKPNKDPIEPQENVGSPDDKSSADSPQEITDVASVGAEELADVTSDGAEELADVTSDGAEELADVTTGEGENFAEVNTESGGASTEQISSHARADTGREEAFSSVGDTGREEAFSSVGDTGRKETPVGDSRGSEISSATERTQKGHSSVIDSDRNSNLGAAKIDSNDANRNGNAGANNIGDCEIVIDLLPLYIENMVNPKTTSFVAVHLAGCAHCKAVERMLESGVQHGKSSQQQQSAAATKPLTPEVEPEGSLPNKDDASMAFHAKKLYENGGKKIFTKVRQKLFFKLLQSVAIAIGAFSLIVATFVTYIYTPTFLSYEDVNISTKIEEKSYAYLVDETTTETGDVLTLAMSYGGDERTNWYTNSIRAGDNREEYIMQFCAYETRYGMSHSSSSNHYVELHPEDIKRVKILYDCGEPGVSPKTVYTAEVESDTKFKENIPESAFSDDGARFSRPSQGPWMVAMSFMIISLLVFGILWFVTKNRGLRLLNYLLKIGIFGTASVLVAIFITTKTFVTYGVYVYGQNFQIFFLFTVAFFMLLTGFFGQLPKKTT